MLKLISAKLFKTSTGLVKIQDKPDFIQLRGKNLSIDIDGLQTVKLIRNGSVNVLLTGELGEKRNITGKAKIGDILVIAPNAFFDEHQISELGSMSFSTYTADVISSEAWIITFDEVKIPSPLPLLKSLLKLIPERKIFIRNDVVTEEANKNKKTTFSVGIILLVLLVVSVGFGIRQKRINEENSQKVKVEEDLKNKAANGIFESTPELFLDLTLLASGFKGDEIISSGGDLYVLDRNSKKVVSIGISTKKSEVVVGQGKVDELVGFAAYEDRVFVSDSTGIREVDQDNETIIEKTWEGSELISAFAGNVYVLDKQSGQIYRYAGSNEKFGERQNWLSSPFDFSEAKSWTFDGSIYVVTNNKVLKFSQGSPRNFSLDSQVLSVDAMYADEENEYLYVLDKVSQKIFVLEKDGKYKAQYSSDKLGEVKGLVASESEKKVIFLTGEKLLTIEMK